LSRKHIAKGITKCYTLYRAALIALEIASYTRIYLHAARAPFKPFNRHEFMNSALKKMSISLILLASMSGAFAEPGRDRDGRDQGRQERMERGGGPQRDRQGAAPGREQRGGPEAGPDRSNRQSRLSPEERRVLRRQINEAGHEVYAPRQ
jgi:hypothetical protein